MSKVVEQLCAISSPPADDEAFNTWLDAEDALAFLKANVRDGEFVVYATPGQTFIHAVLVPAVQVTPPDVDDLLSWNFTAYGSWGITHDSDSNVWLSHPFENDGKTFNAGQRLVFVRSFEGRVGEKGYWEVLQPFVHTFDLHYLEERRAYCRLDNTLPSSRMTGKTASSEKFRVLRVQQRTTSRNRNCRSRPLLRSFDPRFFRSTRPIPTSIDWKTDPFRAAARGISRHTTSTRQVKYTRTWSI